MAGQTAPLESVAVYSERACTALPWDPVQRVLDVVLVAITLPLWVPVVFLMVAVKLVIDGRPLWFRHVRLGSDGDRFTLYKIRTTPPDFEPGPHDWSDEEFPPRTRFGRWLRRFDLDELPQLWNVLKGEMSLVGPRPEMPAHAEAFSCRFPHYERRLGVRPGLTGLAQVRGWRGDTSILERLRSDLEYVGRRGAGMYFSILARTVSMEGLRLFGNPSADPSMPRRGDAEEVRKNVSAG
ncbi:MAG TPA: sugar transferase [Bryobacteraceae bacterium]|nr:sugar transferase [Bryobacteraceae bacterium]